MIIRKIAFTIMVATAFIACNEAADKNTETEVAEETKVAEEPAEKVEIKVNTDSLVKMIDQARNQIESSIGEAVQVPTENLKEKIKQKWSKIHFYTLNDQLVRIKTYPYSEITSRTEEFYLKDGELILAVIEDDGEGDRGKSIESIDKLYYFNETEVIKEIHAEKEVEYSIKESDGEELLGELNEYLDIYKKHLANN